MPLEASVTKPISISQALRQAIELLSEHRVGVPRLTAEVLLSHVLGVEKSHLYGYPEKLLSPGQVDHFDDCLGQRISGKPTQYITGVQEFYGIAFRVEPGVLIPRPETELLVEEALSRASRKERILDLGTGSGCVAVSIKANAPATSITAADISGRALRVARRNAAEHGLPLDFVRCDLDTAFQPLSFDMVVCNPPYVPLKDLPGLQQELRHEPSEALFGGQDGLAIYRRLMATVGRILKPGGWLLLELGYNGRSAVEEMFSESEWHPPIVRADLAGIDRVLAVRRT
ncbi:MAG: peptide chain release factor N(5)-glutamine methyltransferase [Acidobacteria bacterium]|nr:peptide chain release factor N(5)-glutamine methyltransferase [Acidobacteriota bacterium]